MEPRCTGMCGALATSAPVRSKTAQEKSSRSLMFTEEAVFCSVTPICSAIDMKRLLKTSSITGSASVPSAACRCFFSMRRKQHVVLGGDLRAPAGLDDDRLVALDDQRRAGDLLAGFQRLAAEDRGVAPFAAAEEFSRLCRARLVAFLQGAVGLVAAGDAAVLALHFDRLDDQRLVRIDEAELRLVRGLEGLRAPRRSSAW